MPDMELLCKNFVLEWPTKRIGGRGWIVRSPGHGRDKGDRWRQSVRSGIADSETYDDV